jgi:hypothetical protein
MLSAAYTTLQTMFCLHASLLSSHGYSYHSGGQELFSFALSENMVAAGGQGDVLFWDRRMQQQLEKFDDMHMDDVTQVLLIA